MSNIEKLQAENRQLQFAVNELQILNDVATAISSVQSMEEIIDQIVLKCIRHMRVEEGTVSLLDKASENQIFQTMVRHKDSSGVKVPFRMDTGLKGWMLKNRTCLLYTSDAADDYSV